MNDKLALKIAKRLLKEECHRTFKKYEGCVDTTCEDCALNIGIKSIDMRIPKKFIHTGTPAPACPNCREHLYIDEFDNYPKYCGYCGQAIDWGKEND